MPTQSEALFANVDRPAIVLYATYNENGPGRIHGSAIFTTPEALDALVAKFPKSTKIATTTLSTHEGGTSRTYPMLDWCVNFRSTGVTGEVNEGGIKRYNSLVRAAAKHGVEVVWITSGQRWVEGHGEYATQADFEAAIDA